MRRLPEFQYFEPQSVAEAAGLLGEFGADAMLIGGGTDLVPSMRQGLFAPKYVISLQAIDALRRIAADERGLRIGALATLRSVESDATVRSGFPLVARAAHEVGSPQLREMATVGGNICLDTRCTYYNQSDDWRGCSEACVKMGGEYCRATPKKSRARKCFAVFSADLATALVALDARVNLQSARGKRSVPMADFYTGDGALPNLREADELLTDVVVPAVMEGITGTYLKYRVRQSIDYPIAGVALTLRPDYASGTIDDVRLVVGGIASRPVIVNGIADLLNGKSLDDGLIEAAALLARKAAKPLDNTSGERGHRKQMVYEFTRKALSGVARNHATSGGERS